MNVKLTFNIDIDVSLFKNLTKSEIKQLVKDEQENGSIIDHIKSEILSILEQEDYNKM
jgi:hypothetical protein